MTRHLWQVGAVTVALLFTPAFSLAQHGTHGTEATTAGETGAGPGIPQGSVSLRGLLRELDETLRQIERAVGEDDTERFTPSVAKFLGALDSLEAYLDAPRNDPQRLRKEVSRMGKALERGEKILTRLSAEPTAEFRDGLSAALDAGRRVRDAVVAAAQALEHSPGSEEEHHGRRTGLGHGCGHGTGVHH